MTDDAFIIYTMALVCIVNSKQGKGTTLASRPSLTAHGGNARLYFGGLSRQREHTQCHGRRNEKSSTAILRTTAVVHTIGRSISRSDRIGWEKPDPFPNLFCIGKSRIVTLVLDVVDQKIQLTVPKNRPFDFAPPPP